MAKKIDLKGKTVHDFYDNARISRVMKSHGGFSSKKEMLRNWSESARMDYLMDFADLIGDNDLYAAAFKARKEAEKEEDRIAMEAMERGVVVDF